MNKGPVFYLLYVSSAVKPFTDAELRNLLEKTVANNSHLGMTGLLLYKDGNFMQALEGEELAVRALYAKIARDPRHRGLLVLSEGPLPERQFPDWSMGFRNLDSSDVQALPGYSEFLNTPLTSQEFTSNPSLSQRLLTSFKKSM